MIYRLLVQAGREGMAAGLLVERLNVPSSSLSFHLAQLFHAGLILQQRKGRSLIYSADYSAMDGLMGYLGENCCTDRECSPAPSKTGRSRAPRNRTERRARVVAS